MITQQILDFFFGIIDSLLALLPTASLPAGISGAVTTIAGQAHIWDGLFPVGTAFLVLGLLVGFETIVGIFKLSRFVFGYIRGVNLK